MVLEAVQNFVTLQLQVHFQAGVRLTDFCNEERGIYELFSLMLTYNVVRVLQTQMQDPDRSTCPFLANHLSQKVAVVECFQHSNFGTHGSLFLQSWAQSDVVGG
jgi:hypothetical protein